MHVSSPSNFRRPAVAEANSLADANSSLGDFIPSRLVFSSAAASSKSPGFLGDIL